MDKIETQTVEEIKAEMASQPPAEGSKEIPKEAPKESPKETPSHPILSETAKEIEDEVKKESLAIRLEKAYSGLNSSEKNAWNQGWRTEEFFVGKRRDGTAKQWINAEEFLGKTKEALPVANERNKELAKKLEEANLKISQISERVSKAEERGYNKALSELHSKQKAAVESGDVEAFEALKTEEMSLINDKIQPEVKESKIQPEVPEVKESAPAPEPEASRSPEEQASFKKWVDKNDWIYKPENKLIVDYAIGLEKQLMKENPYLNLSERLEIVDADIRGNQSFVNKIMPAIGTDKFSLADSGNASVFGKAPQPKGYNDLPADAKKSCETLIKLRGIEQDKISEFRNNYTKVFLSSNINN